MLANRSPQTPFNTAYETEYEGVLVRTYKDGSVRLSNLNFKDTTTLSFEDLQRLALEARLRKTQ